MSTGYPVDIHWMSNFGYHWTSIGCPPEVRFRISYGYPKVCRVDNHNISIGRPLHKIERPMDIRVFYKGRPVDVHRTSR